MLYVIISLGGTTHRLGPGAIIGRLHTALLRIDSPHISEVHAILLFRHDTFRLLSLRGPLMIQGSEEHEVELVPGTCVELPGGIKLEVSEVCIPQTVLAVTLDSHSPRALCGEIYSLVEGPPRDLVPRYDPDARLWIVCVDEVWRLLDRLGSSSPVRPGRTQELIGGGRISFMELPRAAITERTTVNERALTLVLDEGDRELVTIERYGRQPHRVPHLPGRMLYELAAAGRPLPWMEVVHAVWGRNHKHAEPRESFDSLLRRLRVSLDKGHVRKDLVEIEGGHLILQLRGEDRVERRPREDFPG